MFQRNFPSDRRIHSTQWRCNVSCRSTSVINVDSGPLSSWRWKQRTVRRSIDFKCDTWCPVTSLKFFLRKWIISCHFRSDFNFFFKKKGTPASWLVLLGVKAISRRIDRRYAADRFVEWMQLLLSPSPPSHQGYNENNLNYTATGTSYCEIEWKKKAAKSPRKWFNELFKYSTNKQTNTLSGTGWMKSKARAFFIFFVTRQFVDLMMMMMTSSGRKWPGS